MCRCLKERCRNNRCNCRKAGKKCEGCWCINCQNLSEPRQIADASPEKSLPLPAELVVKPELEKQQDPLPAIKQKQTTPAKRKGQQVKVDTPSRKITNHGDCCQCEGDCSYEQNCKCLKEGLTCRDSSCLNKDFSLRELDPPLTIMLER